MRSPREAKAFSEKQTSHGLAFGNGILRFIKAAALYVIPISIPSHWLARHNSKPGLCLLRCLSLVELGLVH